MPQVSADAHVPVRPEIARAIADSLPTRRLRVLPHVRNPRTSWRVVAEGSGSRVIVTITYAAGLGRAQLLAHEPTQWVLRRHASRLVADLVDACASAEQVRAVESRLGDAAS